MLRASFRDKMPWLAREAAKNGLAIYAQNSQACFATISNSIYVQLADLDFEAAVAMLRAGAELARVMDKPLSLSLPYGLGITIATTLEGERAIQAEAAVIICVLTSRKLAGPDRN